MKAVKRWRYYCDHCKKGSGRRDVIEKHEPGCTNNPERVCGMCALVDNEQKPIGELKALVTYDENEWGRHAHEGVIQALREATNNCPACIVAALRQTETITSAGFDVQEAFKAFWMNYNDAKAAERESAAYYGG